MRGKAYCYFHLLSRSRSNAKGRPLRPLRIEFQLEGDGQSHKKPIAQLKEAVAQGRLDRQLGELCIYGMNLLAHTNKLDDPRYCDQFCAGPPSSDT